MKKLLGLLAIAPLALSACGSKEVEVKSNVTEMFASVESVGNDARVLFGHQTDLICYYVNDEEDEFVESATVWSFEEYQVIDIDGVTINKILTSILGTYNYYFGWSRVSVPNANTYIAEFNEVLDHYISEHSACEY